MKKVLNLYANIWWNRKLREDVEVTAIEWEQERADYYKKQFPNDTVIVTDAHEYLLNHYKEFDFIRSSPPCPTHSDIRRCWVHAGQYDALYPDMQLYQEIILLRHLAPLETKRVVENVKPYYDLLIPGQLRWRHIFWSNFVLLKNRSSYLLKELSSRYRRGVLILYKRYKDKKQTPMYKRFSTSGTRITYI